MSRCAQLWLPRPHARHGPASLDSLSEALACELTPAALRRQIAPMNLGMALSAVGIEHGTKSRTRVNWRMPEAPMSRMTSQAQKGRRLEQHVVGHRAMRIVADGAILFHRRMLIDEWAALLRMAFVTDHVEGRLFKVIHRRAVGVVTIRAYHLTFPYWMVRR